MQASEEDTKPGPEGVSAVVLYSASTIDELAFREQLLHQAENLRGAVASSENF